MRKIRTLCHFSTELIEFSCSLGGRSCIMIVKRRPSAGADEDNWSSLQRVDSCCIRTGTLSILSEIAFVRVPW
ncbi:uncharacterized protein TNCV_1773411 [Trichonephila clavipes]|nr:uncharacterized protein TNCV_1773411 [Trichonephila clavipes]